MIRITYPMDFLHSDRYLEQTYHDALNMVSFYSWETKDDALDSADHNTVCIWKITPKNSKP